MTTDPELHIIGSQPIHLVVPLAVMAAGFALGSDYIQGAAFGMIAVVLASNMRLIDTYRWRVDDSEPDTTDN